MKGLPASLWPVVAALAGAAWPPRDADEARRVLDTAQREDLLPLLLDEPALPPILAPAAQERRAYGMLARRQAELRREAMHALLRAAGPDALLFYKGADFALRLYPQPALRPMRDVDVLVAPGTCERVLATLAAAGHARVHAAFGAAFRPTHHEVSVLVGAVHVELHRSFAQRVRSGIDYDALWRRREAFALDAACAQRLAPADALLVQAYNLALDEFDSRLIRFVDLYLLLQRHPDALPAAVAQAKAWKVQHALFGALALLVQLFPECDGEALRGARDALLDARRRARLLRLLPDRRRVASGPPARLLQLQRKFALFDQPWRAAWFVARHVVDVPTGWWHEWRARRAGAALPRRAQRASRTSPHAPAATSPPAPPTFPRRPR